MLVTGNIDQWMNYWANQLQDGILFLRPDRQSIVFINEAAFQLLETIPESRFQVELLLQDPLEEIFEFFLQYPEAADWKSQVELTLPSFRKRSFSLHALPVPFESSKTLALILSPLQPAHPQLPQSESVILHSLFEHSPNALVVIDPDGKVVYWNPAAERLTDVPRSAVIHRPAAALPEPFKKADDAETPSPKETTWFTWDLNGCVWHAGCASHHTTNNELQQVNEQLWHLVTELEQRNREVNELNQLNDMLQSCLDMADARDVISRAVPRLLEGTSGGLYIIDEDGSQVLLTVHWGDLPFGAELLPLENCWGLRRVQIHSVQAGEGRLRCSHTAAGETCAHFCAPLVVQGKIIGLLSISDPTSAAHEPSRLQLIETLAGQMGLAISNLRLREGLHHQAIHDALTGLYNRHYMEESFNRELRRAVRHNYGLAVLMISIDQFAEKNNTLGRETGDVILVELARFLSANVRGSDIACRFSGTEFVLILTSVNRDDAQKRGADLCIDFRRQVSFSRMGTFEDLTLSIGVAAYPENGSGVDPLLNAADEAMRCAHNAGGNVVFKAD